MSASLCRRRIEAKGGNSCEGNNFSLRKRRLRRGAKIFAQRSAGLAASLFIDELNLGSICASGLFSDVIEINAYLVLITLRFRHLFLASLFE